MIHLLSKAGTTSASVSLSKVKSTIKSLNKKDLINSRMKI